MRHGMHPMLTIDEMPYPIEQAEMNLHAGGPSVPLHQTGEHTHMARFEFPLAFVSAFGEDFLRERRRDDNAALFDAGVMPANSALTSHGRGIFEGIPK
jgi:hypothetical protein